MLEGLKKKIGWTIARWSFRKLNDTVVHFTTGVRDARKLLLVLPLDSTESEPVKPVIELLRDRFSGAHITAITPMHSVELIRMLPPGTFIKLEDKDISSFFLPRSEFMHQIQGTEYDAAFDLNLDFQLTSGYIARASNARIRVGFASDRAEAFYNFIVRTEPGLSRPARYKRMAECLLMF
jgi:ADP-heptose:LPS heptosyltransferase